MEQNRIQQFIANVFNNYQNNEEIEELKLQLFNDLEEKYQELLNNGLSQENALQKTLSSMGDINEIIDAYNLKKERPIHKNYRFKNLENCDFSNSDLPKTSFSLSNLDKVDFSNANLPNGNFRMSNLDKANFSQNNVTNGRFSLSNLDKANFSHASQDM